MHKDNDHKAMSSEEDTCQEPKGWYYSILDSVADGVFTVDRTFRITSFNKAAEQITGYTRDDAIGHYCYEIFKTSICMEHCTLKKTLTTGVEQINVPVEINTKDNKNVSVSISTSILKLPNGEQIGGVETFRDLSYIESLKKQLYDKAAFEQMIGLNSGLKHLSNNLNDISQSDANVLIQGPSGTGKGLLAAILHQTSHRAKGPFVKVNCGALPESLLESELFGYEKGAFTDARKNKPGRIAIANGGTLFLDEIGDIPLTIQVKLLRFIQEKEYEALGGNRTLKADVRIITATHQNLPQLIKEGRFREDLYYRLNIIPIHLPALAERKDDIPKLVQNFIHQQNSRNKKNIQGISEEAMNLLVSYPFPGNIRELENAIEHAFVLCRQSILSIEHLPHRFLEFQKSNFSDVNGSSLKQVEVLLSPFEQSEAQLIMDSLKKNKGNKVAVSDELRMHRTTLWRKMQKYNLVDKTFKA